MLHQRRLFHRDLKLENIGLIGGQVILLDLDGLYYQPEGSAGFHTIMGMPEFGSEAFRRLIIEEDASVEAMIHDYAGLAHIWINGRIGRP